MGRFVVEAAAALPGDVVSAAEARGKGLDLREMAVSLLNELTELNLENPNSNQN